MMGTGCTPKILVLHFCPVALQSRVKAMRSKRRHLAIASSLGFARNWIPEMSRPQPKPFAPQAIAMTPLPSRGDANALLADVRELILSARQTVARGVNAALVVLYWKVGRRIRTEILKEKRAEYGAEIVVMLSRQLTLEFGDGFGDKNLRRMIQFAEAFPDERIVVTLSRQLGWSHFIALLPLRKHLQRDFYAEMCRLEQWSVRTLRRKIGGMLYERTALSKKPAKLAELELKQLREEDKLTPDLVFRDPYFFDFLGLKGAYSEKDLETAILRDLQEFLVELGSDFAFLARRSLPPERHEFEP
jgi:predicted nuclease of restriction endonuclease-like (RecB) superfamily